MRIRTVIRLLLPCLIAVLWSFPAFACETRPTFQSPKLRIFSDLDGDQLPDTATVRHRGESYVLSIHFSTKRAWTRVQAYTSEPVIGIAAIDVDGDHDQDIVLLGLNPLRPSGLWLNEGAKGFRSARPWLVADLQELSRAGFARVESIGENSGPDSLDEPSPEALVPHYVLPTIFKTGGGLMKELSEIPFSGQSSSLPLRGPPLHL